MRNKLRLLYWSIEINLILWLLTVVMFFSMKMVEEARYFAVAGLIFAAVVQHWAFYYLRREYLKDPSDKTPIE